ncbi:hypothetical protein WH47_07671, partial [Habropoda laboriosa]
EAMWYQHNGCPAHYSQAVIQVLDSKFQNRWTGRNGRISWSASSPDLTPLDSFLCGKLEDVYRQQSTTPEDTKNHIIAVCATITSEAIQRATQSVMDIT